MTTWLPQNVLRLVYQFQFSSLLDILECNLNFAMADPVTPLLVETFLDDAITSALSDNVFAGFLSCMSNVTKIVGARAYVVATDNILYGDEGAVSTGNTGALTGGVLLPSVAMVMKFQAFPRGRKYRSRIFVPGVVTPTSPGRVAAAQFTAMDNLSAALIAPAAISGNARDLCIVHAGTPPGFTTLGSITPSNVLTQLRSRKPGVGS